MSMPLPHPILGSWFLMKPEANVMLADGNCLARVGFQSIGLTRSDNPDDFLLELQFFPGELGFGAGGVVVRLVGDIIKGVEKEIFERRRNRMVVVGGRRADLEAAHQGL
uniref:Uncharacterized protein LOC103427566 isoform X3 n=1 Tax=Rhizophora mucronata TaxID=61149 RepID=A0A2P2MC44_RHIMU